MATPFLSSEEYDERAHQLYNEGQYDEALSVLREGLTLYPNSVELHVGVGYATRAMRQVDLSTLCHGSGRPCASVAVKRRTPLARSRMV